MSPQRERIAVDYDVLVMGAGISGICAAVSDSLSSLLSLPGAAPSRH